MQTRKDGEIFESETGAFDDLSEKLGTQLESGEVDSGTIANQPEMGRTVKIDDLEYEVVNRHPHRKTITLKLKG